VGERTFLNDSISKRCPQVLEKDIIGLKNWQATFKGIYIYFKGSSPWPKKSPSMFLLLLLLLLLLLAEY
jgi:hypothetical protein